MWWEAAILSWVSGFALKVGDDALDEGFGPGYLAPVASCTAVVASVGSVALGVPPSFPVGLALGNGLAGKLDDPVHVSAALVVCLGSVLLGGIPDPVSLGLVTFLSALDEILHEADLDVGLRPALKVGLPLAWVLGIVPWTLPVVAWCFDVGYHVGGLLVVRASHRFGGRLGRGASEGCGTGE